MCWYPHATGALNFSANFLQSSIPSDKITPAPESITGNFELDNKSAALLIASLPPEGLSNFYILHEGMVAALDGELFEEDYDDIEDKKFSKIANKGWFGIGDKYWISSIVPPRNKEFKI